VTVAELSWKKAIEKVLAEAGGAMHYKDIAEEIVSKDLRNSIGATPASTVNVVLNDSIKKQGDDSAFQSVGKGEYILRRKDAVASKKGGAIRSSASAESSTSEEEQYEIVSSFGMFWRRDYVEWGSTPKLLGMQQIGAQAVDFSAQLGIYLLYDGREVIYVGRSSERPLGRRLYEHTVDRLSTRWDRFSWFGLLPVSSEGKLGKLPREFLGSKMIPALEAILIEALEPRQNRKRGDDLSAAEYFQMEDPEIDRRRKKALLRSAFPDI